MRKRNADILTEEDLKINENIILVLPYSHEYKSSFLLDVIIIIIYLLEIEE